MNRIPHEELLALCESGDGPRVSMYLPLERAYPAARENPSRLRAAIGRAEHRLWASDRPVGEREIAALLAPARELAEREEFRRGSGSESLAVLLAPGFSRVYPLPFACEEVVDVGRDFRLAPLARLANWPDEFYLLALSLNVAKLYYGSPAGLSEVELPAGTPENFVAFVAGTEAGRAVRFQSTVGAGTPRPFLHGGTSHTDYAEVRREEYVRAVAGAVAARTARVPSTPLVLAAAEELHPIFRSEYPGSNLTEPGLHGCPDHLGEAELRERSARLVESRPDGPLAAALERFRRAKVKSADAIEAVAPAAAGGRVDTLLLACGGRVWGRWNPETRQANVAAVGPEGPPRSEDLAEFALRETLRHGGRVFVVEQERVPGAALISAVLRW
jgi:hypothetical protein